MKTRISNSISRLVIKEPFYASIVLGVDVFPDDNVETFCTNGLCIKWSPKFAATLADEEILGTMIHEVEHIARLHPWRRENRDPKNWNIACDYVINGLLVAAGYKLPKGALIDSHYNGMSEEQVYAKLPKNPEGNEGDGDGARINPGKPGNGKGKGKGQGKGQGQGQPSGQGQGQGQGQGPVTFGEVLDCPGTEAEKHEQLQRTKVEVIRAAKVAKSQGKLPAHMTSLVDEMLNPKASWQELLRNYLSAFARDDYSWVRPNVRYLDTGFSLPSMRNPRMGTMCVVIDTSGSIGQTEFNQFLGELNSILESVKPERTILIQADAAVAYYEVLECGQTLEGIEIAGGGGTDFRPAFERLEREGETPEVLVYLTDGYGSFPESAPYPVLWAMTTDVQAPFGEIIKIG